MSIMNCIVFIIKNSNGLYNFPTLKKILYDTNGEQQIRNIASEIMYKESMKIFKNTLDEHNISLIEIDLVLLAVQINYCLDIYPLNQKEFIKLSDQYNELKRQKEYINNLR